MTKEILIKSAIRLLINEQVKQGSWGYALETDSDYEVSWKDVLKWLEQQPCEDCISREALDDAISELTYWHPTTDGRLEVGGGFDKTVYKVEDVWLLTKVLPSVIPQPKKGHWIRKTKVDAYDIAGVKTWGIECQCDRCNFTTIVIEDFGYYKYCPNCGADMRGDCE